MAAFLLKAFLAFCALTAYGWFATDYLRSHNDSEIAIKQLEDSGLRPQLTDNHLSRARVTAIGWSFVVLACMLLFVNDVMRASKQVMAALSLICIMSFTGCWRPFEPIKLEVIKPNEEAFLLPYTQQVDKQTSTHSEEYLKKNLVFTQQVKMPQQWVQKGFEWFGFPNGAWQDAALLVKVDKQPITKEWTADTNSGTSNKNEAVWVMTADQVEFSTGWTCTARIANRDDAVKFLYNYPNGSLSDVMDREIRAKLQATFGLEVTDRPMDTLRKQATPHIQTTIDQVKAFFQDRGISITNIGITGGFVYKDSSIMDMLVKVFNAEQAKNIAIAATAASTEEAKRISIEAETKAKAARTEAEGQADSIKTVADAKEYEIQKAEKNTETYVRLKQIEVEKAKLEKWDGKFPTYYMGASSPDILLQVPMPAAK